jgi:hypothetical protein
MAKYTLGRAPHGAPAASPTKVRPRPATSPVTGPAAARPGLATTSVTSPPPAIPVNAAAPPEAAMRPEGG